MRHWRVGSLSMGILLITLGITLWLAHFFEWDIEQVASLFIPFLLLLIGTEIIVHSIRSRREQALIKYDIFSIFFTAFIGFLAVILLLISSTGLFAAMRQNVFAQEHEIAVEPFTKLINESVNKVVIQTNDAQVSLTNNTTNELSVFGSLQTNADNFASDLDYLNVNQVGDILYLTILRPTEYYGIVNTYHHYDLMISIPSQLDVEVNSFLSQLELDLTVITANWDIAGVNELLIRTDDTTNHQVKVTTEQDYSGELSNWGQTPSAITEGMYQWQKTFGDGQYLITVNEVWDVVEVIN
ncbi:hypothetical protein SAMN04488134_101129 [Amphibacillus marinus]|uniref:Uncharacterized protein n=1 Tax=Amphibacillus marinus TaxID=872970 RepID=A0A1H8GPQ9_9BACI|nr:hypothetical protein [Amphibacillus marinus]SEN45785.1 hypothetical protein SAMN04488134_101129 [Amphibacillus marinus]